MKQQSNRYKTSNGILKTLLPMMLFTFLRTSVLMNNSHKLARNGKQR